jgi:hypothetical protein
MPECKNILPIVGSPKQSSISDIIQESFENYIRDIEDEIEQLISEMEPFHSEIVYTLDELVDIDEEI